MNLGTKLRRIRLSGEEYAKLRRQVLERDGWRCQGCGRRTNLEVHHQEFRSRIGDDEENNLISLCSSCHRRRHLQGRTAADSIDANPSACDDRQRMR